MKSFETRGMRKKLTAQKIFLFPVILLGAILTVMLYGALFDPAFAANGEGGFANWLRHNIAPVMFFSMAAMLIMGYPTAFTLAAVGMLFGVIGIQLGELTPNLFLGMPDRVYGIMSNDTLLAIPFFTFMGLILERSGMAEDLLDTIGQLFGTIRGGLAYAVIFVGALLAATTGVVAASVIAMGLISLPIMMRYGYDKSLATGVIAASGTLAQIIPPSLVLIIMADQLGRSVGDMYTAAFIPGIVITLLYALWVFIYSMAKPHAAPGLPDDAIGYRKADGGRGLLSLLVFMIVSISMAVFLTKAYGAGFMSALKQDTILTLGTDEAVVVGLLFWMALVFIAALADLLALNVAGRSALSPIARATAFVLIPPLFLIFLVLGTIIIGLATPTEGGAMGAIGALALAGGKRLATGDKERLNGSIINDALLRTAKLSSFVLFILIGARVFSLTFYGVSGHHWVKDILTSVTGNQITFLFLISAVIFIFGCFLDFFEIAFIAVPLLLPAAELLGIDFIWLGIILSINLQSSFLTPPFGFALIYMRSVAPNQPYIDKVTGKEMPPITTSEIYKGALPFIVIQVIMVIVVIFMPSMVMHYKGSEIVVDEADVNQQLDSFGSGLELDLGTPSF